MTNAGRSLLRFDRRAFLAAAAAGSALIVGCRRFGSPTYPLPLRGEDEIALNHWVVIGTDGSVTFLIDEAEMGQGVHTALAMVLAEELGADWSKVRAEHALCDPKRYGYQGTAASTSVRHQEPKLRKVGAAARHLLIGAAAEEWGVAPAGLRTERGSVVDDEHGRRATFGTLAAKAAQRDPPEDPPLLSASERWLTGTSPERLDFADKVTGRARFGLDTHPPGVGYAAIARAPGFGATVRGFDDSAARAVRGVRDVVRVPSGIAVVADDTWAALTARDRVVLDVEPGPHAALDSASITAALRAAAGGAEAVAFARGRGAGGLAGATARVEAELEVPFLAHTTMEPLNATASVTGGFLTRSCEVWAPTQAATEAQWAAAAAAGVDDSAVLVHTTLLGGGFGRKGNSDFVREAVDVSTAVGRPVQVVLTRSDELASGYFRPCALCQGAIGLDEKGRATSLTARLASVPILLEGGVDPSAVEGFRDLLYAVPDVEVRYAPIQCPVPVGFWRSVGSSQNAFFLEVLLDEAARAAGRDPVAFRLELLPDDGPAGRLRRVLERAAARSGWGGPLEPGRARGVAAHACFDSYAAQVAEVSLEDGAVQVHRVTCAFDCGPPIHPDAVRAQVEGAICFGLGAALHQAITLEGGRVVEHDFATFPSLTLPQCPAIDVEVLASDAPIGGVGEPATPPIAPAVANAVAALLGRPVRRLPLRRLT